MRRIRTFIDGFYPRQLESSNAGQVGIIILLTMVVMLTLGISVVSRSASDVSVSRSAENANKTLDAAESGAEQALSNVQNAPSGTYSVGSSTVKYAVAKQSQFEAIVPIGVSAGIDVTGVSNGNVLNILWGTESGCGQSPSSLAITVYKQSGSPLLRHYYYTPSFGDCSRNDGFTQAASGSNGYTNLAAITLQSGDTLVRVMPVYNQASIRISSSGNWVLPTQQYQVTSSASNTLENQNKVVAVTKSLDLPPTIFDYVVFSGTSITQ